MKVEMRLCISFFKTLDIPSFLTVKINVFSTLLNYKNTGVNAWCGNLIFRRRCPVRA